MPRDAPMHPANSISTALLKTLPLSDDDGALWPEWSIQMYTMTAKFLHVVSGQTGNREFNRQAMPLLNKILRHTATTSDARLEV